VQSLKQSIHDLAICGGPPAFEAPQSVGRPNIGNEDKLLERLRQILNSRWLTNYGPLVQEFEQCLSKQIDVKHCIAVCNATVGLEIAIRALGLSGAVIAPSFTFIATAHALQWQGISPVFCDVDPLTHNLDPARVEDLITPSTTAILGVHLWGRACDVDALAAIARKRKLKLLFDAAHAFSCSYHQRSIGGFGDAEIFSFHATKFLNSFEGGAIATNDDDLARRIRLMVNFGFSGYDNVIQLGTNGKMTEIAAAMGLTSLESLHDFIAVNRRNHAQYQRELAGVPRISLMKYDEQERSNYHYIILEIEPREDGLSRDDLVRVLHAENVVARRYFYPGCHRMAPYRLLVPEASRWLPATERLCERVLALPNGETVRDETIGRICEIIRLAMADGVELKARLAAMV
jgi:dTDP-4-amino-4,6-dideoxygalactose transaminase